MSLVVVNTFLTQAWVGVMIVQGRNIKLVVIKKVVAFNLIRHSLWIHFNQGGIRLAKREGIAMDHHFHGIAQWGVFHQFDNSVGDDAHI